MSICQVNDEIEDMLLHETPSPERAWLPSSPESPSPCSAAPLYRDPLPGTVPKRIGKFEYPPPTKRIRSKSSREDVNQETAKPAEIPELEEGDFEADEEAAKQLEK